MNSEIDNLRKAWLMELLKGGILTSHSQTLPDDYKWSYLTKPAFKFLFDLAEKYEKLLRDAGVPIPDHSPRPIQSYWIKSPDNIPKWYMSALESLEMEGGSPRQMQLDLMRSLNCSE